MNIPFRYIGVTLLSCVAIATVCYLSLYSGDATIIHIISSDEYYSIQPLLSAWLLLSLTFPHLVWYVLTKRKLFGVKESARTNDYLTIAVIQFFALLLFAASSYVILATLVPHGSIPVLLVPLLPVIVLLTSVPAIAIQKNFPNKSTAYVYKLTSLVLILTVLLYAIGAGVIVSIRTIQEGIVSKRAVAEEIERKSKNVTTQSQKPAADANLITLPNGNSYIFGAYTDEFSPSGKKVAFFANENTTDPYSPPGNYTLYVYNFETKQVKTLLELPEGKTFFRCIDAPKNNTLSCGDLGAPGITIDIKWLSETSLEVWYYDEHFYYDPKKVESTKKVFTL